jgi:hypothetical protein
VRYSGFSVGYNICVAAAVVSLGAVLTVRETARRPLRIAGSDEVFQSGPDVRGAAATR